MTLDVMVLLTSVNWSERSDPDHSDLEFRFCALVPARYFRWRHSLDSLETGYVFVADSISYWPSSITAFMVFIRILRQNADRLTAAAEKFFFICVKSTYCQLSVCVCAAHIYLYPNGLAYIQQASWMKMWKISGGFKFYRLNSKFASVRHWELDWNVRNKRSRHLRIDELLCLISYNRRT